MKKWIIIGSISIVAAFLIISAITYFQKQKEYQAIKEEQLSNFPNKDAAVERAAIENEEIGTLAYEYIHRHKVTNFENLDVHVANDIGIELNPHENWVTAHNRLLTTYNIDNWLSSFDSTVIQNWLQSLEITASPEQVVEDYIKTIYADIQQFQYFEWGNEPRLRIIYHNDSYKDVAFPQAMESVDTLLLNIPIEEWAALIQPSTEGEQ